VTKREKFLLRLLGLTVLAGLFLWAGQSYLDEVLRLDQQFLTLQKEASQIQARLLQAHAAQPDPSSKVYPDRFFEEGKLPEPLVLARAIRPSLDSAGVEVKDFQVVTSTPKEFVLRYSLEAPASAFLKVIPTLRAADPQLIVRRFAATLHEKGIYSLEWEVGYATLP